MTFGKKSEKRAVIGAAQNRSGALVIVTPDHTVAGARKV
jgi:hypothetical protein